MLIQCLLNFSKSVQDSQRAFELGCVGIPEPLYIELSYWSVFSDIRCRTYSAYIHANASCGSSIVSSTVGRSRPSFLQVRIVHHLRKNTGGVIPHLLQELLQLLGDLRGRDLGSIRVATFRFDIDSSIADAHLSNHVAAVKTT